MSSLRTFFPKTQTFQKLNFHGSQNMDYVLLSPKDLGLAHTDFRKYTVSKLQFFSENLLLFSLITAIGKYIYRQNCKLSRALAQSSLCFKFESFLSNDAKMAAILIFCQICDKTMFFPFSFVFLFLLTIYLPKYLQFPLSNITNF